MNTIISNLKTPLGILILITVCLQVYLVSFYEQLNFNYKLLFSKIPHYAFGYETFDLAKNVIWISVIILFILKGRMMLIAADYHYTIKRRRAVKIIRRIRRLDKQVRFKGLYFLYLMTYIPFKFRRSICQYSLNYRRSYIHLLKRRELSFFESLFSTVFSIETIFIFVLIIIHKTISGSDHLWFWELLVKIIIYHFFLIKVLGSAIQNTNIYSGYRNTINAFLLLVFFHVLGVHFGKDHKNLSQLKEYEKITFCDLEKNENFSTNKSLTLLIVNSDEWVFRDHIKNKNRHFKRSKMRHLEVGETIQVK